MKYHKNELVQKAKILRRRRMTLVQIGDRLKIPNQTISRWVHNLPPPSLGVELIRLHEAKLRKAHRGAVSALSLRPDSAKLFCALLYWCAGAKYPASNFVAFTTSDAKMSALFVRLLRRGFRLDEKKFRIQLQLHSSHNLNQTSAYWSKLLKIPRAQFYPAVVTKLTSKIKREDYRGTCTVRYYDVKLLLGLMGIYESAADKMMKLLR